ncbi:MAG: hypothetical protein JWP12_1530 [Bacteroidetes bacterium]|nr:hypothetical protein [Bacteroidota bacterium]
MRTILSCLLLLACGIANAAGIKSDNSPSQIKRGFIIHASDAYVGGINKNFVGLGLGFEKPISQVMEIYVGGDYFLPQKAKGVVTGTSMNWFGPQTTVQFPVNLTYNLYRINLNGYYHFLKHTGDKFTMYAIAGFSVLFALSKNNRDAIYSNPDYSIPYDDKSFVIAMYGNLGVGATIRTGKVYPFFNAQYNIAIGGSDADAPVVKIPSVITATAGLRIPF